MLRRYIAGCFLMAAATLAGYWYGNHSAVEAASNHVFELRTYTAEPGKLDALNARFRDHTMRIFDKHAMKSVAYFTPQDDPMSKDTLIYMLEFPSRDAAKKAWEDFRNDPEWQKVQKESEANGKLVSKVVSVFADPTPFSPMK